MNAIHKELASGKWRALSLFEQLGNIGSEVNRAINWKDKDKKLFEGAVDRALELFDLTLADPRWLEQKRLYEIARAREVFCDAVLGGKEYGSTLKDLNRYLAEFAIVARGR
jgi:hypothetical protein